MAGERLRDGRLAVVTDGVRCTLQVLESAALRPYVDAIVTSRDFGAAKPDPAIFREAARRLDLAL